MNAEKYQNDLIDWITGKEPVEKRPDNITYWDGPDHPGLHITGKRKPDRKNQILKRTLYAAIAVFVIACLVISFFPWIGFTAGVVSMAWILGFALANGWLK